MKRSLELKDEQSAQDRARPEHLRGLFAGKKTLLFKEILNSLGYPDASIALEIDKGFDLTGWAPKTGVFSHRVRRPVLSESQLAKAAIGYSHAVVSQIEHSEVSELDSVCWNMTQEEVKAGWLTPDLECNPADCCVAKRFPLQQRNKCRLIDDFSISGANSAYGLVEKLRVDNVDLVAACGKFAMDTFGGARIVGRTFDLVSAYKQFGVSSRSFEWHRVAVKDPQSGRACFFKPNALPFGATASVTAFLRISAALAFIVRVGLWSICSCFFDDFTLLSREDLAPSADAAFRSVLKLLGVAFAEGNHKDVPFGLSFKSLGIVFNFESFVQGAFEIGHSEDRCKELLELLSQVADSKHLSQRASGEPEGETSLVRIIRLWKTAECPQQVPL